MNKKIGILVIIVLSVLLIGSVSYYLLSFSKKQDDLLSDEENNKAAQDEKEPVFTVDPKKEEETSSTRVVADNERGDVPVAQIDLERMAKSFAERFGSFSNQSNFSNIKDLEMFMSEKMKKWASSYLASNQKDNVANQVYYGMTTKSLSAKAGVFDEAKGQATVIVETRRREAIGNTNNNSKLYNQSITITFVKENQAWKVDSAIWQE